MAQQWFKFYGNDFLMDPKMLRLTSAEKVCWITLLCLASNEDNDGLVTNVTSDALRAFARLQTDPLRDTDEYREAGDVLKHFEELQMIEVVDGGIYVKNFKKRQESHLTNAERQQRFRDKRNAKVTGHVTNVTEKNRIEEKRKEKKRKLNKRKEIPGQEIKSLSVVPGQNQDKLVTHSKIVDVIDVFRIKNPSAQDFYQNTTQREAVEKLIGEFGFEKTMNYAMAASNVRDQEFAPVITTPLELYKKWSKLEAFVYRGVKKFQDASREMPEI